MTAHPTHALLVNPHSGGGMDSTLLEIFEQTMIEHDGHFLLTSSAEHAREFISTASDQGFTRLILSGGDDSVRDVLPALLASSCEMGLVPNGTFNNLALALGLSLDPIVALRLALTGTARKIDLGTVAGHYFTESAGVGFLAEAWNRAPQPEPTGFLRWASGFLAASAALVDYQPLNLEVSIDGAATIKQEFWDLTIANAPLFANNISIAPEARLDDGQLDVCLWGAVGKVDFLSSLPAFFSGQGAEEIAALSYRQAQVIEVRSEQTIPVRIDNTVVLGREFRFEVLADALRVVAPDALEPTNPKVQADSEPPTNDRGCRSS